MMGSRISEIAPKLQKLMLLLSSNQPGEVAAAAAAIERALRAVDMDWHDLANTLAKSAVLSRGSGKDRDSNGSDWQPLHEYCRRHLDTLSSREQDFMTTLDHWHGDLTEKQRAWLDAIHYRLRRREGT